MQTLRQRPALLGGSAIALLLLLALGCVLLTLCDPGTTIQRVSVYHYADIVSAVISTHTHPCAGFDTTIPAREGNIFRITTTTRWRSSIFIDRNGQTVPLPVPLCIALRALDSPQVHQPTFELARNLPPGEYMLEVNGQPYPFRVR